MNQRQAFVAAVSERLDADDRLVVLLCDVGTFAFRDSFAKHPDRILNCGCAEAATVGFAAGLAIAGFYPVVSTIEPFLVRRAYEFILLDFGYQHLAGLFIGVGAPGDYANLGPSHECPETMSLMHNVPGMIAFEAQEPESVAGFIEGACECRTLSYMRIRAT